MFGLKMPELILIAVIIIFLFGARRIPEMAKGIADGIKTFKKSMKDDDKPTTTKEPLEKH